MDKRVYLLTAIAFIVGMVELIIGGILDLVAEDLNVSIGKAGLLITIFAFVFGISGPIFMFLFGKVERKRVTILALLAFFLGNILSVYSYSYFVLLISRIITATSGALLTVLCLTLAAYIVKPEYRGRAIGLVVMGISGSIVIGLPIGVGLGHSFGWRSPFILTAILTILLLMGVSIIFRKVNTNPPVSLIEQFNALKNIKIISAHLTTFFFLAGHFVLYGYLTPFVIETMKFDGKLITIVYLIYGVAAVIGGGLAGWLADRIGTRKTLFTVIGLLFITLIVIPYTPLVLFWVILIIWGILSWSITPPIQSHLVQLAPKTAEIQQSINNALLHLGIALGTLVGSFIVEQFSVKINPLIGAIFVIVSFGMALVSLQKEREVSYKIS